MLRARRVQTPRRNMPPRLRGGAWGPRVTFRRGVSIPPNHLIRSTQPGPLKFPTACGELDIPLRERLAARRLRSQPITTLDNQSFCRDADGNKYFRNSRAREVLFWRKGAFRTTGTHISDPQICFPARHFDFRCMLNGNSLRLSSETE